MCGTWMASVLSARERGRGAGLAGASSVQLRHLAACSRVSSVKIASTLLAKAQRIFPASACHSPRNIILRIFFSDLAPRRAAGARERGSRDLARRGHRDATRPALKPEPLRCRGPGARRGHSSHEPARDHGTETDATQLPPTVGHVSTYTARRRSTRTARTDTPIGTRSHFRHSHTTNTPHPARDAADTEGVRLSLIHI